MALVYTWLRLSSLRQLDWYRRSNYQSKDIAHVQKHLAERVSDKARSAKDPWSRALARMALEGLPRGGGNGCGGSGTCFRPWGWEVCGACATLGQCRARGLLGGWLRMWTPGRRAHVEPSVLLGGVVKCVF
jgi:hypothetical protein